MDAMLQSVPKTGSYTAPVNRNRALNVRDLDVSFGGFTPMPLNDANATRAQVRASEERLKAYHDAVKRAADLEAARVSEAGEECDAEGTTWRYSVLDGKEVRIEGCVPNVSALNVPPELHGLPVVSLAPDSLAYLVDVVSIIVPDTVQSIGGCAFRGDAALESAVLPRMVADFNSDWFRGCSSLSQLVLPGLLRKITSQVFDIEGLERLTIGSAACEIEPGSFAKSRLAEIQVDPENPYIGTDGVALYDISGSALLALAIPVEAYDVIPSCVRIVRKGMSTFRGLRRVTLPDGLEEIGPYAFAHTSLAEFKAPPNLRTVGERAFFDCGKLSRVCLNDGLLRIESDAFSSTALSDLTIPASIEELKYPLAAGCGLTFSGEKATCRIAKGSKHLWFDEQGGLYRNGSHGPTLVYAMDETVETFDVPEGTVEVAAHAFEKHVKLRHVSFPKSLARIGESAFKGCHGLASAQLPENLEVVGSEAFLDTSIESLRIPRSLTKIGDNAFVSLGAHNGRKKPSLKCVEVEEGNPKYHAESGMLFEHWSNGKLRILLYAGEDEVVRIPKDVISIAPYAFNGVRSARELYLSDRITQVGMRGLSFNCYLELIHVDLDERPMSGKPFIEFRFPAVDRSVQQIQLAFNSSETVSVESLYEHYDNTVIAGNNYDAKEDGRLSRYEQCGLIVARLKDPVCLSASSKGMMERILRNDLKEICVDIARHDDRTAIDDLLDLGFLTQDTIDGVIERVSALRDAAMTGHLLEVKRRFFELDAFDFEL